MQLKAWIAALLGGGFGAAVWAGISHFTHMEIGYVAWGIGALVGYLAKRQGGKGKSTAVGCALVALASILGGKGLSAAAMIREYLNNDIIPQAYQRLVDGAKDYRTNASDAELAQFMASHQFADNADAAQIPPEQVAEFRQSHGGLLEAFAKQVPTLAQFASTPQVVALQQSAISLKNISSTVKDSLGVIDMVFGALGVATAYQVVAGQEGDDGGEEDDEEEQDGDGDGGE